MWDYEYPKSVSARLRIGLHRMDTEALERWSVPQLFPTPLTLLQFSLISFLSGFIPSLISLNTIGVIFLSSAPILCTPTFSFRNNLSPAFHDAQFIPQRRPRVRCPYKTPLSWAIREFLHPFLQGLFDWISEIRGNTNEGIHVRNFKWALANLWAEDGINSGLRNWIDHGRIWLVQRDIERISPESDLQPLLSLPFGQSSTSPEPLFNVLQAVLEMKESGPENKKPFV